MSTRARTKWSSSGRAWQVALLLIGLIALTVWRLESGSDQAPVGPGNAEPAEQSEAAALDQPALPHHDSRQPSPDRTDSEGRLAFDFTPSAGEPRAEPVPPALPGVPQTADFRAFRAGLCLLEPLEPLAGAQLAPAYLLPLDANATLAAPTVPCATWAVRSVLCAAGLFHAAGETWDPREPATRLVQLSEQVASTRGAGARGSETSLLIAHPLPGLLPDGFRSTRLAPDLTTREPVGTYLSRLEPADWTNESWYRLPGKAWRYMRARPDFLAGSTEFELESNDSADLLYDATALPAPQLEGEEQWLFAYRTTYPGKWTPAFALPVGAERTGELTGLALGTWSFRVSRVLDGRRAELLSEARVELDRPGFASSVVFDAEPPEPAPRGTLTFAVETPSGVEELVPMDLHRMRVWPTRTMSIWSGTPRWSIVSQTPERLQLRVDAAQGDYHIEVPYAGLQTTVHIGERPADLGTFPARESTLVLRVRDNETGAAITPSILVTNVAAAVQRNFDLQSGLLNVPSGYFRGSIRAEGYEPRHVDELIEPGTHVLDVSLEPDRRASLPFEGKRRPTYTDLGLLEQILVHGEDGGLLDVAGRTGTSGPGGVIQSLRLEARDGGRPEAARWLRFPVSETYPAGLVVELRRGPSGQVLPIDWGS